jgi:hypothetical protein
MTFSLSPEARRLAEVLGRSRGVESALEICETLLANQILLYTLRSIAAKRGITIGVLIEKLLIQSVED